MDELDHVSPHKHPPGKTELREREFMVKWHDMSYWHCDWVSELQVSRQNTYI